MDVMVVVNYVKENPAVVYPVLTFLMALLPIPKKNEKLIALRKLCDFLAGNFGNAKNKGVR